MENKCWNCGIGKVTIRTKPLRHLLSPSIPTWGTNNPWKEEFCSKECQKEFQSASEAFWANVDRNASDSDCFEHIKWGKGVRIGRCKITGDEFQVQPLMFGENSGQPQACYDHFVLHKSYRDILDKYA